MVEELCACDTGLAVLHSHVWKPVFDGPRVIMRDDGSIRIWVDWKAVAHGLALAHNGGKRLGQLPTRKPIRWRSARKIQQSLAARSPTGAGRPGPRHRPTRTQPDSTTISRDPLSPPGDEPMAEHHLLTLMRRILSEENTAMLIEPADTGRYKVRIETGWVDITESEADLLGRIFEGGT